MTTGVKAHLNLREVAAVLSVSVNTVKRMQAAGELPAGAVVYLRKRRLFSAAVLAKWISEGCPATKKSRR